MSNKKRRPKWGKVNTKVQSKVDNDKRFPLARCKTCSIRSYGVLRDAETGKIEREFNCKKGCSYYQLSGRQE